MTVMRMATPRAPIPVTVDTFEASGGGVGGDTMGGGTRSVDAYKPQAISGFVVSIFRFRVEVLGV